MTASADPFRDRTESSDGTFPENWPRPSDGDFIIGEVTAIQLKAGRFEQPVLGILCEDKEREYSVWLPQHMREDIVSTGLKVGERVSIKFYGMKASRSGREYQNYGLMIDPKSRIAPSSDDFRAAPPTQGDAPDPRPPVDPEGGYDDGLPF